MHYDDNIPQAVSVPTVGPIHMIFNTFSTILKNFPLRKPLPHPIRTTVNDDDKNEKN